jgi:hypothetical protein
VLPEPGELLAQREQIRDQILGMPHFASHQDPNRTYRRAADLARTAGDLVVEGGGPGHSSEFYDVAVGLADYAGDRDWAAGVVDDRQRAQGAHGLRVKRAPTLVELASRYTGITGPLRVQLADARQAENRAMTSQLATRLAQLSARAAAALRHAVALRSRGRARPGTYNLDELPEIPRIEDAVRQLGEVAGVDAAALSDTHPSRSAALVRSLRAVVRGLRELAVRSDPSRPVVAAGVPDP